MGGRHRTAAGIDAERQEGFPERRQRQGFRARALVVVAVLLVLAAGTAAALAARAGVLGCLRSQSKLSVAAAPDIAPALQKVAQRFHDGEIGSNGRCVDVTVTSREPEQVVDALSASKPGQIPASALADVWVPDSSVWLDMAKAASPDNSGKLLPATSIAHSPVVVALPRPVADQLHWQEAKLGWSDLLKRAQSSAGAAPGLRLGLVDPNRSAPSLLALVALRNLAARAGVETALVAAMRSVSTNVAPTERNLLDELPQTRAEVTAAASRHVQAFPFSEQGVWRYNVSSPPVPLAALYPVDGRAQLDYPYVPISAATSDGGRQDDVQDFLHAVQSSEGRSILQEQAFRTTDDVAGAAVSPANGLRWEKPAAAVAVKGADLAQALRVWTIVTLNVRMLAVIDVSGSMLTVDPGARRSRIDLTREGAAQGLALLSPDSEVGLWEFSTDLRPGFDYIPLTDVTRLSQTVGGTTQRDLLNTKTGGLSAIRGGSTGLYDTALAAYRKMTSSYNPDALNSVVLFTDGKNEDERSITLARLLAELKRLHNPKKPIPIYTIGFGKDVDASALRAISQVTGGQTLATADPAQIRLLFLQALSARVCPSGPCKSSARS
jgi:hypothetical protein